MKRLTPGKVAFSVIVTILGVALHVHSAAAITFLPNNIIDDRVFDNVTTLTAAQIDSFLNGFASSCISQNNGFGAPDPTGYSPSGGFTYGGTVSAGQVIYDAAQAYGLNPQVLLTTLQKEQSLVSGSGGCSTLRYAAATGYGCPDGGTTYSYSGVNLYSINGVAVTSVSGTCVNSSLKVGFSQQVIRAAWLLKFGEQRSEGNTGWAVIKGSWNNSDDPQTCYSGPMTQGTFQTCPSGPTVYYDGYTTIDGTATHMDDGATAALYWYTPHFAGNQNFFNIFTGWFGATVGPGYQFVDAINPPATVLPNDVVGVQIRIRNMSGQTWYSDGNVPAGQHPLRLAMLSYQSNPYGNTADANWLGTTNQIRMQEVSVPDGSIATFVFTYRAPLQRIDNFFARFIPLIDGVKMMPYTGMSFTTSTPSPVLSYSVVGSSGVSGNMPTSAAQAISYTVKNTGNVIWWGESGQPAGGRPIRLLTVSPYYHASTFYDSATWASNSQVLMASPSAGIAPGGTATFNFTAKTPATIGTYNEQFGLVLDGGALYPVDSQMAWSTYVSNYNYSVVSTDMPSQLLQGQKYSAKVILKNTGTATWYSDGNTPASTPPIRLMTAGYRSSPLADTTDTNWLNSSQVRMTTVSVAPGQNGEFDFTFIAPYTDGGSVLNDFKVVADGLTIIPGDIQASTTIPARSGSYQNVGGVYPAPTTMTKGQVNTAKLLVRNDTNFVWYSDDARPASLHAGSLRMLMLSPAYRSSLFANSGDLAWLGTASQIKMTTASVAPGQTAEFDYTWKAPNQSGTFTDRFGLVLDGYQILQDIGMQVTSTVQ